MSLVLIDGMEDSVSWVTSGTPTYVAGRNGNCTNFASGQIETYTIPAAAESDTVTVGCAFKMTAYPSSDCALIALRSDAAASNHMCVVVDNTGAIAAKRVVTQLGITVASFVTLNVWHYIETQIKMHDTTGTVAVKLDGVTCLNLTGQDTKQGGTKAVFDSVRIGATTSGGGGSGNVAQVDDLYIEAGAGDPFLGDIVVETLYPNGDGHANQWLGNDGDSTSNYLLVDEVGAPAVTDYVADSTSGHQDMYALTNLVATTGTILGVCHTAWVAKTDAVNTRQIKLVNRRSTDTKGATETLTTSYAGYMYMLALDPETSAAWTITNVNALQSGVEVV